MNQLEILLDLVISWGVSGIFCTSLSRILRVNFEFWGSVVKNTSQTCNNTMRNREMKKKILCFFLAQIYTPALERNSRDSVLVSLVTKWVRSVWYPWQPNTCKHSRRRPWKQFGCFSSSRRSASSRSDIQATRSADGTADWRNGRPIRRPLPVPNGDSLLSGGGGTAAPEDWDREKIFERGCQKLKRRLKHFDLTAGYLNILYYGSFIIQNKIL